MLALANTNNIRVEDLTQEQLNYILSHIQYDKVKKAVEKEVIKTNFDVWEQLENFLSQQKATTARIYKSILTTFLNNSVHIVDIDTIYADNYIQSLAKAGVAPATIRIRVAAISSFYSKLIRWGFLSSNPFSQAKLPEMNRAKELEIPNIKDVDTLIEYYIKRYNTKGDGYMAERKREAARKMLIAITVMTEMGLRVGAIAGMKVKNGRYETTSKGKVIRGDYNINLNKYGIDFTKEFPFEDIKGNMVMFNIAKVSKKLLDSGKISCHIHPHSFRHYYAVKLYKETRDIYAVSRMLNHSNVGVTQRYLASLESVQ